LEDALEDRVEPPRPDVLLAPVDVERGLRDQVDGVVAELDGEALGGEELLLLLREGIARLTEDADEVFLREVVELDANRKAPLKLGHEVARLAAVERAGGDEEDVIRLDRAVLGNHGASLHDRQQVALHALARDVRSARAA